MSALPAQDATESSDDDPALAAAIAGDGQAFTSLYDRYVDRVYRYIAYRVSNRADTEDLTQQVFLQAWQAIGRYQRTGATFIAWLLTIAHNTVVNFWRRAKTDSALGPNVHPLTGWGNPEPEALARADGVAVRQAVAHLKPEQQLVITMRFLEHLDCADIAAAIGKSEGNVRVIQHRALAELRCLLSREAAS